MKKFLHYFMIILIFIVVSLIIIYMIPNGNINVSNLLRKKSNLKNEKIVNKNGEKENLRSENYKKRHGNGYGRGYGNGYGHGYGNGYGHGRRNGTNGENGYENRGRRRNRRGNEEIVDINKFSPGILSIIEKKLSSGATSSIILNGISYRVVTSENELNMRLPVCRNENGFFTFFYRVKHGNDFKIVKIVMPNNRFHGGYSKYGFPKKYLVMVVVVFLGVIAIFFVVYSLQNIVSAEMENKKYISMQKMARGLAHEIKNPLNSMSMSIEMLLEKIDDESSNRYLNIIRSEIKRLDDTVTNFMKYSSEIKVNLEKVNLINLIENVIDTIEPLANDSKITIELKKPNDEINLKIDKNLIFQAILNIVKNGIEAIENEGKILINVVLHRSEIEIKIENNGPVIPQETLNSIFDYFYTTKNSGSGVGLALTKNFIEKNGGKISCTSDENKTIFSIILPA